MASAPLPAFPSSAVDGYAVRAADAGKALRVVGESAAGRPFERSVEPGTAIRILTGGVLPEGADCVVMMEDVALSGDAVTVPGGLKPGQNFHAPGADLRAGEVVLPAGVQLGAAEIGLAAALGLAELPVGRRPLVALLSTGDELVEVGKTLARGQIHDSNRWALLAALRDAGAEVRLLGIGPDEPDALRRLVVSALAGGGRSRDIGRRLSRHTRPDQAAARIGRRGARRAGQAEARQAVHVRDAARPQACVRPARLSGVVPRDLRGLRAARLAEDAGLCPAPAPDTARPARLRRARDRGSNRVSAGHAAARGSRAALRSQPARSLHPVSCRW